jgi:hypothetical protein
MTNQTLNYLPSEQPPSYVFNRFTIAFFIPVLSISTIQGVFFYLYHKHYTVVEHPPIDGYIDFHAPRYSSNIAYHTAIVGIPQCSYWFIQAQLEKALEAPHGSYTLPITATLLVDGTYTMALSLAFKKAIVKEAPNVHANYFKVLAYHALAGAVMTLFNNLMMSLVFEPDASLTANSDALLSFFGWGPSNNTTDLAYDLIEMIEN